MKEQDKRAVEGMARYGIDLDGLIAAFPKFSTVDIQEIYNEIHKNDGCNESITIGRNCS